MKLDRLRSHTRTFFYVTLLSACVVLGGAGNSSAQPAGELSSNPVAYVEATEGISPDRAAARLLQRARERTGDLRVIVGLRIVTRMEHTLSPEQIEVQRAAQRSVEDRIIRRVFGAASSPRVDRFDFIPYISMFVDERELVRLLADPDVVSVQEDIGGKLELTESIAITHTDDVFARGIDGSNQVVAVLDSGVAKNHPMLRNKIVSEACYSTTDAGNDMASLCPGGAASSTASGSGKPCELAGEACWHGTHVASIAAGNSNQLDGIARGAKIISIKIMSEDTNPGCLEDCITNTVTNVIQGLERVYALRNDFDIAAVNMSFNTGGLGIQTEFCDNAFPAMTTALDNLRNAGIAPIKSSGNSGQDGVTYPGCVFSVTTVGNTTNGDVVARSSNHSFMVKFLAPGSRIRAAVPGGYAEMSGTSMAAPHVAGAFALMRHAKPSATVDQILAAISCSAKPIFNRQTSSGNVALDPRRPRIDLFGAYIEIASPLNVVRRWLFSDASDAIDWSAFVGGFRFDVGELVSRPGPGWAAAFVPSCMGDQEITVRLKRIDPSPAGEPVWNTAVFFKTLLFYPNMSGYMVGFNKLRDPATNKRGQAFARLVSSCDFTQVDDACGFALSNCPDKFIPLATNGYNTIKIRSVGTTHTFTFNGVQLCQTTNSGYTTGPVMVAAATPDPEVSGHQLQIDSVTIKSLDEPTPFSLADILMDPSEFARRPPAPVSIGSAAVAPSAGAGTQQLAGQ